MRGNVETARSRRIDVADSTASVQRPLSSSDRACDARKYRCIRSLPCSLAVREPLLEVHVCKVVRAPEQRPSGESEEGVGDIILVAVLLASAAARSSICLPESPALGTLPQSM